MKQNKKIMIIVLSVVIIIPLLLEFVIFRSKIFSPVSNDGWAGFFGAYIGAIIGALTTYITVNLEIRNNENIRKEEIQREFKPYLYFRLDKIDKYKGIAHVILSNFGKYAAFDIKGYIVKNGEKILGWDQHFCIGGNSEFNIIVTLISDDQYYLYEYKDMIGRKYEQIVRVNIENDNGWFNFCAEPPLLIE